MDKMICVTFIFKDYNLEGSNVLSEEIKVRLPFRPMVGDRMDTMFDTMGLYEDYNLILNTYDRVQETYSKIFGTIGSYAMFVEEIWIEWDEKYDEGCITAKCGIGFKF